MTRASRSVISQSSISRAAPRTRRRAAAAQPVAHRARLRTGRSGNLAIAEMPRVVNTIGFQGERIHAPEFRAYRQNSVENPSRRVRRLAACGAVLKTLRRHRDHGADLPRPAIARVGPRSRAALPRRPSQACRSRKRGRLLWAICDTLRWGSTVLLWRRDPHVGTSAREASGTERTAGSALLPRAVHCERVRRGQFASLLRVGGHRARRSRVHSLLGAAPLHWSRSLGSSFMSSNTIVFSPSRSWARERPPTNAAHAARGARRFDARAAVLDHHAAGRLGRHLLGRVQEQVRRACLSRRPPR